MEDAADFTSQKIKRTRSPGYPAISLSEAFEKVRIVWGKAGRHPVPLSALATMWEISPTSSTGLVHTAALKHFGLLDEVESTSNERFVRLSTLGIELLNRPPNSEEYKTAVRRAALAPAIYSELWERFGSGERIPSDEVIKPFLLIEKGFNKDSVARCLSKFHETVSFSRLGEGALLPRTALSLGSQEIALRPAGTSNAVSNQTHDATKLSSEAMVKNQEVMAMPVGGNSVLPIPLEDGRTVLVPIPMSQDDFEIVVSTLQLWRKRLTREGAQKLEDVL